MVDKIDAETQTDPEITGVDADDFEEDDGEGEESGSESSENEDDEMVLIILDQAHGRLA